ncbi:MAG: hypothetical protein QXX64_02630 [Nitrososphaera sp.]|uniref:Methyl-accepting chemotaxis protein n=1 Tax=Nitrososphaera gargensis (strain Ga9.2) TaxID=1237085 RepID=K0IP22_NITGG|nr:hypothetical protein [Candidatus Nitrososphaera gargensis]AFU60369.1 hypothetical protein Ngar_c34540 [Candidatus Nitrososphaera gargensis Ga9.2]
MASKKGIALTIGIAAAIIGSSFLIWYIPQSSPGGFIDAPRTDSEVIGDVYARHNDLATSIELRFEQWKNNNDTAVAGDMPAQLASAKSQIEQMRRDLDNHQPAQEWQESYDIYMQALDSYAVYLDALELKVDSGDKTDPDQTLDQRWRDLVDQSVEAMPI